jgi:hypothetical protein
MANRYSKDLPDKYQIDLLAYKTTIKQIEDAELLRCFGCLKTFGGANNDMAIYEIEVNEEFSPTHIPICEECLEELKRVHMEEV